MNHMFYESSRIVEKQEKHEKLRAYDLVESLEKNGLDFDRISCALELMSRRSKTEFQSSIISKAKQILLARKEKNEANGTDSTSISINSL